jgi:ribosomal protein L11 methyltransferase
VVLDDRIWVGPPWEESPAHLERFVVDPGQAFGTGEHPTTQMCLLRLFELRNSGMQPRRVLDLGTGSGILALACARWWPRAEVWALDLDPLCGAELEKNARWNAISLDERFHGVFGPTATTEKLEGVFDLLVSNIYAEVLETLLPQVIEKLHDESRWLTSGIVEGPGAQRFFQGASSSLDCVHQVKTIKESSFENETWHLWEWRLKRSHDSHRT